MNREILLLAEHIKDTYQGDPWFGRNVQAILQEIDEEQVFEKPSGQHSILDLLWHMITWKEFVVSRFRQNMEISYFDKNDWRELDLSDHTLWKKGLHRLAEVQNEMVDIIQQQKDEILDMQVSERPYNFRVLLRGIAEHDIYHLGQIAYIHKMHRG